MTFHFEELIDKYNFGKLSEEEKELFFLSVEYNQQLREEFVFSLKLKYYLQDDGIEKVDKFLAVNKLK